MRKKISNSRRGESKLDRAVFRNIASHYERNHCITLDNDLRQVPLKKEILGFCAIAFLYDESRRQLVGLQEADPIVIDEFYRSSHLKVFGKKAYA